MSRLPRAGVGVAILDARRERRPPELSWPLRSWAEARAERVLVPRSRRSNGRRDQLPAYEQADEEEEEQPARDSHAVNPS